MTPEFPRMSFPDLDPQRIQVTDTTFREGLQAMAPIATPQALAIFRLIARIGGPGGLIRESDFFIHTGAQRRRFEAVAALGLPFPRLAVWIRAAQGDLDLVKGFGPAVGRVSVVMPCSDLQLSGKLGLTRPEAARRYAGIVEALLGLGFSVKCSLEDITRADLTGFVGPLARALADLAPGRVAFRLCDTLGLGLPMDGIGLPRSVPALVRTLTQGFGLDGAALEWHGHNDFHMATANALAFWLAGGAAVNGSVLGLGERSGIAPLEALVMQAFQLRGQADPEAMEAVVELRDLLCRELGVSLARCYPILGEEYLRVRSGIHADGLAKDNRSYFPFDAQALLGTRARPVITDISGTAGLAAWLQATGRPSAGRQDPRLLAMKAEIDAAYGHGRTGEFSEDELASLHARHFGPGRLHEAC